MPQIWAHNCSGISLIEVQQTSDITYRLYDYGRPRDLHLEAGLAVAQIAPYAAHLHQHLTDGHIVPLVNGPYFQLDRTYGPPDAALCTRYAGPLIALPIDCPITIQGEPIEAGACGVANAISDIHFADTGHCLIAQAISA